MGKAYSKVNHQHLVCINFTKMLTTSSSHANFNQITREKRSQILRDNEILKTNSRSKILLNVNF